MERRFLLTHKKFRFATFEWFETKEEMLDFIERNEMEEDDIFETIEVLDSVDVELE